MDHFGFARCDITPEIGCFLYGYVDDLKSESIHDRLNINAFYFAGENKRAFLITADVASVNTAFSEKIRKKISEKTEVPFENIILHATHTHTGPNTDGNEGWGRLDTDYCENILLPEAVKACLQAKANARKAYVGFGMGESLMGVNRRELNSDNVIIFGQNPEGCFDSRMGVFAFTDENKRAVANLVYYNCHGTCAGLCKEISRDWSGGMTDALERVSGVPCAFFCGPEGDAGPRLENGGTVGTIKDVEIMGEKAGRDAVRIYGEIKNYLPLSFDVAENTVAVPLKKRISEKEAERLFREYENMNVNLDGQKRNYYARVKASYSSGYEDKDSFTFEQTSLRIGKSIFVSFPYELFSEIALKIDGAKEGFNVFCLSNANGSEGYFPCDSEICKGGYETDMYLTHNIQPYENKADSYLIKETLRNLEVLECTE